MTSIANNSNSNSSLINTLNASESMMNPSVYSAKIIHPAAATQYVKTDSNSGSIAVNQTLTFNLLKYGIAQQMMLTYTKSSTATFTTFANDFFDVIERVDLLSASKVVDTLTKYDLMAQFSNLMASEYAVVKQSCLGDRATAFSHTFSIPLVFSFFKNPNVNLNLQFNEPQSVRIKFGPRFTAGTGAAAISVSDVYLQMRYKSYNESDFSEILTQNYSEPELNQVCSAFYDENIVNVALDNSAGGAAAVLNNGANGTPVELKNTDCVNNIYVIVKRNDAIAGTTAPYEPIEISELSFTASGQELYKLAGSELYNTRLQDNGWCIQGGTDSLNVYVYKIQIGLWGDKIQSNTLSLRELNNPIINVKFSTSVAAGEKHNFDVVVCEDCLRIYSTTSSTGRLQLALSN